MDAHHREQAGRWLRIFETVFGKLPSAYCSFDAETSGFSLQKDPIVAWALVENRNGAEVAAVAELLDWTREPDMDCVALGERLAKTAAAIADAGGSYPYTLELLKSQGVNPRISLGRCLETLLDDGLPLCVHNGINFDLPRLLQAVQVWAEDKTGLPSFHEISVYDTGLMAKAIRMGLTPSVQEKLPAFWARIARERPIKGMTWSLEEDCLSSYDLPSLELGPLGKRDAYRHARLTAALFERYRSLVA